MNPTESVQIKNNIIYRFGHTLKLQSMLCETAPSCEVSRQIDPIIKRAYYDTIEWIISDINNFPDTSRELVLYHCIEAYKKQSNSFRYTAENIGNTIEDITNCIRYGDNTALYEYYSGDRFDKEYARRGEDKSDSVPLTIVHTPTIQKDNSAYTEITDEERIETFIDCCGNRS